MRVKELSLLGYKSFATRTRLTFPGGVTAVVGPNGSGKSNIADAVRWVLGEVRPTALRARNAEDLIFAGTEKRSRGGLAEVTLVIDNSAGQIDLDFAEVALTRRVHRDGASAYLINGARVRRQDVLDLLGGQMGQGDYTVIGQGLVDRFLSMRPEQRRGLIDEAAGIGPLQRRAERTLRRLAETDDNLTPVRDILADIAPRINRLQRLGQRAARHREVTDSLGELLRVWYGFQYHRALHGLAVARERAESLAAARAEAELRAAAAAEALNAADSHVDELEATAAAQRAEREERARAIASAEQDLAVARVRLESQRNRIAELKTQAAELPGSDDGGRLAELEAGAATLAAVHAEREASLAAAQAAAEAAQAALEERTATCEALARSASEARAQLTAGRSRLEEVGRAADRLAEQRTDAERRAAEARRARAATEAALTSATEERQKVLDELDALRAGYESAEAAVREADKGLAAARDELASVKAEASALEARSAMIDNLFAELDAPDDVQERLRGSQGVGVLGTVAELLSVARGWEAAVAVALGPLARAVVVDGIADLHRALGDLPSAGGTRALASARGSDGAGGGALRSAGGDGWLGACDVATTPEASDGLLEVLLGDVAFCDDLAAAKRAIAAPGGFAIAVTRDGARLERRGTALVGGEGRELFALAGERRDLPSAISDLRQRSRVAAEAVDELLEARRAAEGRLGELAEMRSAAEARRTELDVALDAARDRHAAAQREDAWCDELQGRLEETAAAQAEEAGRLEASVADAEVRALGLEGALEAATAEREGARAALGRDRNTAAEAAAEVAESARALAGTAAQLDAVRAERTQVDARRTALEARVTEAEAEVVRLEADVEAGERVLAELQVIPEERGDGADGADGAGDSGDSVEGAPANEDGDIDLALSAARRRSRSCADELEMARRRLAADDSRLSEARLAASRAEDRIGRLSEQLDSDDRSLDLPNDMPRQLALDPQAAAGLPDVPELPAELESQIASLRAELRRIGPIDREALEAYEETARHHEELQAQLADLEAAESDLREALQRLDEEMNERFDQAFQRVAREFSGFFPRLFGGGDAELRLQGGAGSAGAGDEEGGDAGEGEGEGAGEGRTAPGIEILARPPGKRPQPLALLSGGERALTAVALIFALLRVSETPFVVLDEVDAALDEANVDRFRGCLSSLAETTQVVIVTHNRATVQSADTVYGVTMGEDGASRTISLRVEEAA